MASVYRSLGCLFLHCRLIPISLKGHQHQTQTFTHPIISKIASKSIFLTIQSLPTLHTSPCVCCPLIRQYLGVLKPHTSIALCSSLMQRLSAMLLSNITQTCKCFLLSPSSLAVLLSSYLSRWWSPNLKFLNGLLVSGTSPLMKSCPSITQ